MITIKIKKNGIWFGKKKVNSLLPFLIQNIEIEDGVTFEDFFNHIMKEHDKYSEAFASHLGHAHLSDWVEEWNLPFTDKLNDTYAEEMTYLSIRWRTYIFEKELAEGVEFGGEGRIKEKGKWRNIGFALELTPINNFKNYPLKLDTKFEIYSDSIKPKKLFSSTKIFTVYDVVSAILYEISWFGSPSRREDKLKELQNQILKIKKGDCKKSKDVFREIKKKVKNA